MDKSATSTYAKIIISLCGFTEGKPKVHQFIGAVCNVKHWLRLPGAAIIVCHYIAENSLL